jgi:hypothetical protein
LGPAEFKFRVQFQKEVISGLKRVNMFFSKEIWESICLIFRERSVTRFLKTGYYFGTCQYGVPLRIIWTLKEEISERRDKRVSMIYLYREIYISVLKLDFAAHGKIKILKW